MSHCSQCGRYVGPYEACPHCGARMAGRVSIRSLKALALGLGIVGFLVLWAAATRSDVPGVRPGQVGETMNFAYVRVEGRVVGGPNLYPDSGSLSFTVADDSGEVRVWADRNEAETLRSGGQVPALGDRVSVAGTLRVRPDGVSLILNVPQHLEILRPEAVWREIGSLGTDDYLRRVRVRGQVWAIRQPNERLTLITLRDSTGSIDLAVSRDLEGLSGALLPLEPGQSVEATGAVDLYRGTPQMVPASVADILLLTETVPIASPGPIGGLGTADRGRLVMVQGTVRQVQPFSAGLRLLLDDGTGEIVVVVWQDVRQSLADEAFLVAGEQVQVVGEVSAYRGQPQIIPQRALDLAPVSRP